MRDALLVQVSAVLVVTRLDADLSVALGLALVAAPLAAVAGLLSRNRVWLPAAVVLVCGVGLMDVAALMVVEELFVLGGGATSARLAAVLLAMALAPAAALRTAGTGSPARRNALVAAAGASVLGALAMLSAAVWTTPESQLAAVAVLGAGGVAVALALPPPVRAGNLVGLDALWPVAARVPRWAAIGAIGLTLLWLGATAEHRLAQLKELGRRFRDLEPDGPMGQSA